MKTFTVFIFGLFMVYCAIAQENSVEQTTSGPVMTFEEANYDFGDIFQGDKVEHTFAFENTGTEPLIITNVQVTCGCTATKWPRDPIAPGQKSEITILFNSAGKMGRQNKVITIVSNATNAMNRVKIATNVLPKKTDS